MLNPLSFFLMFFGFLICCNILSFYSVIATKNIPFMKGIVEIFFKKNYYKVIFLDFTHALFGSIAITQQSWEMFFLTAFSFLVYFFPNFLIKIFNIQENVDLIMESPKLILVENNAAPITSPSSTKEITKLKSQISTNNNPKRKKKPKKT